MASADFCSHGLGYPSRPAFRASSTHGYAFQISPDKNVYYPCTSSASTYAPFPIRFRVLMHAHLEPSASYAISVCSSSASSAAWPQRCSCYPPCSTYFIPLNDAIPAQMHLKPWEAV